MTINENTYNPIQINYTIRRNANGEVTERSTMVNVRTESSDEAIKLYNELKAQLNGELSGTPHTTEDNSGSSVQLFNDKSDTCPKCGSDLKLRKGRSGEFWGCSNYPSCRYTQQA